MPSIDFPTRTLPPEVLTMVFEHTATQYLPRVLLASSTLYALGYRPLYQDIAPKGYISKRVLLLTTLAGASDFKRHPTRLPNPALVVRSLRMDFPYNQITANLLRLIQRALQQTTGLVDLALDFSLAAGFSSTAWCLSGVSSRLERFHSSVAIDYTFVAWINSPNQRSIKELSLRGHTLHPVAALVSPDALPNLKTLRVVHMGDTLIAALVRDRPVDFAAVTLFPHEDLKELDALTHASVPLKRVTLLCLAEEYIETLISQLAARFPALESLHVVTNASISTDQLMTMAPPLRHFSRLRQITFMAPHVMTTQLSRWRERKVVHEWADACSTLATVILSSGQVWYPEPGSGKWKTSADYTVS